MSLLIEPKRPCRSCTAHSDWTPDIPSSEVRSDAFGSGQIGVSDAELIDALDSSISEVVGPVCIVSRRKVPLLNQWVTGRLGNTETDSEPAVTADAMKDVATWAQAHSQPVTVLAYLTLWERSSSRTYLAALKEVLADGSRLVFVEPTIGVGAASVFQRFAKPMLKRRIGLSFHRDVPAMIREANWQLTTVNRVAIGAPASVMTFVVGEARTYS